MEHTGRDHEVERPLELPSLLEGHLPKLEIAEPVQLLEKTLMGERRLRDVDADDMAVGIRERVVRGLARPATGNEDLQLGRLDVPGPELAPEKGGIGEVEIAP